MDDPQHSFEAAAWPVWARLNFCALATAGAWFMWSTAFEHGVESRPSLALFVGENLVLLGLVSLAFVRWRLSVFGGHRSVKLVSQFRLGALSLVLGVFELLPDDLPCTASRRKFKLGPTVFRLRTAGGTALPVELPNKSTADALIRSLSEACVISSPGPGESH